jgi:phenylalanyl-tRNA synthetase beta chain
MMKVPLSWLKEYVEIDLPLEELAERLTLAGMEVNGIERIGATWDRDKIFVGELLKVEQHPNADRLTLVTVAYGAAQPITVVTGAPNIKIGDTGIKVALALTGARLIDGHSETRQMITLKPGKIRGIASAGMVCSERELGLSDEHEGIILLPADAPVGKPLADYLGDAVLDIDLTPNLSRCFSIIGIAREAAALTGKPARIPDPQMDATGAPIAGQISIEIADPDLCNRYSAALIKGVTIAPSPLWMQRRLTLAGMRPINNIVDITNYVMLEWGQPLHAFDYRRLRPKAGSNYPPAIIVRRAAEGEQMTTLDGAARTFTGNALLITDGGGPVAVGGIMGGQESEIGPETRDVLLEAATFDFINNRRTAQALRLSSEASIRFGRGIPATRTILAARRAAQLMRELAGGEIAAGLADAYPVPQRRLTVSATVSDVERVLGIGLSAAEILDILGRLDFVCTLEGETIHATPPEHRLDVEIPADVYEEIARVYGYDRIPTTLMRDELPPQRHSEPMDGEEHARDILAGCGLQEIISYSLTNLPAEGRVDPTGPAPTPADYVRVANPLSSEGEFLRRSLQASLLRALAVNQQAAGPVQLFEIAAVFLPVAGQQLPDQPQRLGIVMAGPRWEPSWQGAAGAALDFFDMKGIVETLAERLGLPEVGYQPASGMPFLPGRAATLLVKGRPVGQFGEVHPLVKEKFELAYPTVCLAEFDVEALLAPARPVVRTQPTPRYPAVTQDLAVVVDEGLPAATVEATIRKAGGGLLARVALFDVYRGQPIPEGKKSLAFSLQFQAPDRTLTDREVLGPYQKIVKQLGKELGGVLRA